MSRKRRKDRFDKARHTEPATPSLFDPPPEEPLPTLVEGVTADEVRPPDSIQQAFERFHAANPWVAQELQRMAVELVARGHRKVGIGMLFEVLRWRYMRSTTDTSSEFKLNNNYRSRYARHLMAVDPRLKDRFETRELTAE